MSKTKNPKTGDLANTGWKIPEFLLYILGGILIYVIVFPFMDRVIEDGEAQATLISTFLALAAIYFGKICGQVVMLRRREITTGWLLFLVILLVFLVAWLFLITQYPLGKKSGLNLFFFGLPFLVASVLTGILTTLIGTTINRSLTEARITANRSETELSLLQSQLSPHFLFNTLNNVYGISITQHEKVPALLLKLSELLRYSLYQAKEDYVPVRNEIAYLNNYIEFEQLRMGNRLRLRVAFENITDERLKIAPMLLIVFVENAFKHSKNNMDEYVQVAMELKTWGRSFLFSITNSHSGQNLAEPGKIYGSPEQVPADSPDGEPGKLPAEPGSGGLGLVNVRKRLALLYPGEHELNIDATGTEFNVMLQLKIR